MNNRHVRWDILPDDAPRPMDTFIGTPGNDLLVGTDGNDRLDGLQGADTLIGGDGNDGYRVNNAGDVVVEEQDDGIDTVSTTLDGYVLADNVENLVTQGRSFFFAIDAYGNALDNHMWGRAAFNHLYGGEGNDTLESWGVVGLDSMAGEGGDDVIRAHSQETMCDGGSGNDLIVMEQSGYIQGGTGNDTLVGEDYVPFLGGALYGGAGDDLIYAGQTANNRHMAIGDDGNDTVIGSQGNDANLNGGRDADWVRGRGGNDSLYDYDTNTAVDSLEGGDGIDTLYAYWDTPTSTEGIVWVNDPTQVQQVYGNSISGIEILDLNLGDGDDVIDNRSGPGGDQIYAGGGNDSIVGGGVAGGQRNVLVGEAGNDTLVGGSSVRNILLGEDGSDSLVGHIGADSLNGGAGDDVLSGGSGADQFLFDSTDGVDRITDFASGTDLIRLSGVAFPVGDGDTSVDGAVTVAGPGGYAATAELVIVTTDIAGALTPGSVAAAIGSASSAYAAGQTALFAVDNGIDSAVYYFTSSGADAVVSADELSLLALLSGTDSTQVSDYSFRL